jgi:hypothetical protein
LFIGFTGFVIESRIVCFPGEFAMKRLVGGLILVVGLGLAIPGVGRADMNHPHSVQGDSTKSMKAFRKQQKKNQNATRKAEKKAEKNAKKKAAGGGQVVGLPSH